MNENVLQKIMPALPAPFRFAAVATPSAGSDRKAGGKHAVAEELALALEHFTAEVRVDDLRASVRHTSARYAA
jgi:hypothetical protein